MLYVRERCAQDNQPHAASPTPYEESEQYDEQVEERRPKAPVCGYSSLED